MIGRDPVKLLAYEAKRRPVVKEMWGRLETLTDAEIDGAILPLPWYRSAFKKARDEAVFQAAMRAAAEALPEVYEDGANSVRGTTVEYLGDTEWYKTGGAASFEVEVKARTWLFFPETGGCWDYQTFFHVIPSEFMNNRLIANQTRQEYVEAWAAELCRRF